MPISYIGAMKHGENDEQAEAAPETAEETWDEMVANPGAPASEPVRRPGRAGMTTRRTPASPSSGPLPRSSGRGRADRGYVFHGPQDRMAAGARHAV